MQMNHNPSVLCLVWFSCELSGLPYICKFPLLCDIWDNNDIFLCTYIMSLPIEKYIAYCKAYKEPLLHVHVPEIPTGVFVIATDSGFSIFVV